MKKLLYYKPRIVTAEKNFHLGGIKRFAHFFEIFNNDVVIVDRTKTIQLPVMTHALFPMPQFRVFTQTYEEVCNIRAQEILKKLDARNGSRLCIFYSGGIDSTTVLVSLLKNASTEQRERFTVLLSENSIVENPEFYAQHIVGKLRIESSVNFMYLLGTDNIFISGEHNDQLFGSDMIGKLMKTCGDKVIHESYNRDMFLTFFNSIKNEPEMNSFYLDIFERLKGNAPVSIETNYDFLWWINFSLKWQTVFMRQLVFTAERNIGNLTKEYIDTHYFTFFNTDDFQLWSMNNLDKRIKNTWNTYKWVAKDVIYNYTKDSNYRDNKTKVGSLYNLMIGNSSYNFVDDTFNFYKELPIEEYYCARNDFIEQS